MTAYKPERKSIIISQFQHTKKTAILFKFDSQFVSKFIRKLIKQVECFLEDKQHTKGSISYDLCILFKIQCLHVNIAYNLWHNVLLLNKSFNLKVRMTVVILK